MKPWERMWLDKRVKLVEPLEDVYSIEKGSIGVCVKVICWRGKEFLTVKFPEGEYTNMKASRFELLEER